MIKRLRYISSFAMLGCVMMGAICGWFVPVTQADNVHIVGAILGMIFGIVTLETKAPA